MPPSAEQRLDRRARHRLAIIRQAEEVTGNVAQTCRYYGISRNAYYIWYRRYQPKASRACATAPAGPRPARTIWIPLIGDQGGIEAQQSFHLLLTRGLRARTQMDPVLDLLSLTCGQPCKYVSPG